MATELTLIGGGGHALVVARSALRGGVGGVASLRVLDDDPACVAVSGLGLVWSGRIDGALVAGRGAILCVGTIATRLRILASMGSAGVDWRTVVDASAIVDGAARAVGAGTYIGAGAVVQPLATVGAHCIINTGAIVEHECELGDNVHVAPGCVMGGCVRVGSDTLLGLGSRILPGVRVGRGCTVGAGATVTRDVPDGATVVGVPARAVAARESGRER